MRKTAWMLFGSIALITGPALAAEGDSPAADAERVAWARWQGRLSLGVNAFPSPRLDAPYGAFRLPQASLLGDYYFTRQFVGPRQLGGFRATSGLLFGPRQALSIGKPGAAGSAFSIGSRPFGAAAPSRPGDATTDSATLPYLGVGYTGLSPRSGWSFNADLGMVAQGSGSTVRLGRVFSGGQSLDDAVREMRLAPLLQLGVSYSF